MPRSDLEILNARFGFQQRALGSHARDAHECHFSIFAFSSPWRKAA
jgi:hypothetical protein